VATIRFFAAAKVATGQSKFEVSADSVEQALELAKAEFPALAAVLTKCSYLLNELSCKDLSTKLKPTDVLDVVPPFAGG